jgi:hypothetical protein
MLRERDQTRIRHYLIAIAWFAAALANYAGKHHHAQRIEAAYRKALAAEEIAAATSANSTSAAPRRRKLLPGETVHVSNCCIEIRREHLEVNLSPVAYRLLFIAAGILMFWGYQARSAGLIPGSWSAGVWLFQHWILVSPRSECLNSLWS